MTEGATGGELDAMRSQIDTLDEQIVALLAERAKVSLEVGAYKREQGDVSVLQSGRESELLGRLRDLASGTVLPPGAVDRIYAAVLENSRQMQQQLNDVGEVLRNRASPGIASLSPYQAGMTEEQLRRERKLNRIIKLASNENPLGPGPLAQAAGAAAVADSHRYPDGSATELREALGLRLGVDPARITVGAGSDNIFELITRVFLGPGREAVHSAYSFAMYAINTLGVGATPVAAPAHAYGHDADAMLAEVNERTGVVFIANPNNPTGTWMKRDELLRLLDGVPSHVIVVLDEAYFEYVDEPDYPDGTKLLDSYPNLIVTRTFSKIHGLGGLRIGYGMASPAVTDLLNRVRGPFNVARASLAAAVAAVGDTDYVKRSLALNAEGYAMLTGAFRRLGLDYIDSVCNFVTVAMPEGVTGASVFEALLDDGIIVRPMDSYEMPGWLRVSIGTQEENGAFLEALERALEQLR